MSRQRWDQERVEANRAQAMDAFMARKLEIDTMLQRLSELSADHFGADPETLNWGDVGTIGHYAQLLRRITDSAFHEGQHAS